MKHLIISIFIFLHIFYPITVSAQTNSTQRFQPSTSSQRNSSSFLNSGDIANIVNTAAGCADVGKKIIKGITNLSKKNTDLGKAAKSISKFFGLEKKATGGQEVSVTDAAAQKLADEIKDKQEKLRMKEYCYDRAAYTLSQKAMSLLSEKTLKWVNTGFGGNPFYVRNIDSFLDSIKNEQVRDYIRIADNINSGDGTAVGSSVTNKIIEMITGRPAPSSTPSTANELKYDAFTKDFTSGGWDAWYRTTQLGENPIGQVLTISQQLGKNIGQRQEKTEKELLQGNGFLNQKICVEYAQVPGPDDSPDLYLNPDGSLKCLKEETVTPGSTIAKQVEQITGTTIRQLELADEMNEALSRFFSSLIENLFNKGLQSLGQTTNQDFGDFGNNDLNTYGGQGDNIVLGSNGQPINGTGSGVIPAGGQGGGQYDISQFNISNPKHISSVIKTQKNFRSKTLDSQNSMRKILANLGRLDYCIPGPNLSWADSIENNISTFQESVSSGEFNRDLTTGIFSFGPYTLSNQIGNRTKNFFDKSFFIQNSFQASSYFVGQSINSKMSDWLTEFENETENKFSLSVISTAFENLEPTTAGKAFARGFVQESLEETFSIPEYTNLISENDDIYIANLGEVENNIEELESIRAEVLEIVTTARNRHIATKRALGITVNMTCLNEAYDISNTPIVGYPQEESDATSALNALENAQRSFYNNL